MRILLPVLMFGAATAAQACPNGATPLMSCTFQDGAKYLETCLVGNHTTYSFGTTGQWPDLALARPVVDVDLTPWQGIGRYIWESMTLRNSDVTYEVHYSVDRLTEDQSAAVSGGILVQQKGTILAELACDPGTVLIEEWFVPLYVAKQAEGQTYLVEEQVWR